jgi:hypothetical protein
MKQVIIPSLLIILLINSSIGFMVICTLAPLLIIRFYLFLGMAIYRMASNFQKIDRWSKNLNQSLVGSY